MAARRRISLVLSERQIAWLTTEAERLGVPVSELMRRILDDYAEQKGLSK